MELNYQQEQRSVEWFRARLGYITGSRVGVLMKAGRSKGDMFSATATTYLYQLAGERALSRAIVDDDDMLKYYLDQTTTQSKAMRFGTEQEENARNLYSELTGKVVREVGLCHHETINYLASSPDGIVVEDGEVGCIEIKCPTLSTYSQYVAEVKDAKSLQRVNPDYYWQCQNHLACTDGKFCDFVAYCPFVETPIHIVRIERNNEDIALMEQRVKQAENIIELYYQQLKRA